MWSCMQDRLTVAEDRGKEALTERNQLQSQLQTATKQLQQAQDILRDVPTAKQAFKNDYGPRIWALEQEVWRLEDEARNHEANRKWVWERETLEDKYTQLTEAKHQLVLRIVYLEQENMRLRYQTGETELSAPLQAYLMPAEWSAPHPRSWSIDDQNLWLKAGLKALKALAEQGSLLTEKAIFQGQKAAFMKLKEEAAQAAMELGAALPKTLAQVFEEHCVQQEATWLAGAAERTKPNMSEQTAALCKQMVAQVLSLEEPSAQQAVVLADAAERTKSNMSEQTAALCKQMVAQVLSLEEPSAQQAVVLAGAAQHGVQSAAQQGTAWLPHAQGESSSSHVMPMNLGEAQQQGSHTQVCEIAQATSMAATASKLPQKSKRNSSASQQAGEEDCSESESQGDDDSTEQSEDDSNADSDSSSGSDSDTDADGEGGASRAAAQPGSGAASGPDEGTGSRNASAYSSSEAESKFEGATDSKGEAASEAFQMGTSLDIPMNADEALQLATRLFADKAASMSASKASLSGSNTFTTLGSAGAKFPEPEGWQSGTPILASQPLLSPISSSGFFTPDQLHLQVSRSQTKSSFCTCLLLSLEQSSRKPHQALHMQ